LWAIAISGQLEAGFVLEGFQEDRQPTPRFLIGRKRRFSVTAS